MSNLYDEAIADARSLKEMAERNARNKIIESITPRIRKLIERQILAEQEDEEIPNMDLDTPEDNAEVPAADDMSATTPTAMPQMGMPPSTGATPDPDEEVTHTVTTKTASGTEVKINVRVDKHGEASATTETGSASYANAPETYRFRYQRAIGATLETLLAQPSNRSKSACWNLQFTSSAGATTQLAMAYCR